MRGKKALNMGGLACLALLALMAVMMSVVEGDVLFATLPKTLVVTADVEKNSNHSGNPKAGEDHIAVQWALNSTFTGQDSNYNKVVIKLCFAPPSQVNRAWRKTEADLSTDRTCNPATIATQPFTPAGNSTVWLISKDVPFALYFVRAYAEDATGVQLGYGQTTNKNKTTNIITVEPISGRHTSIDIASAVFSAFAVAAFFSYLGLESYLAKRKERIEGTK